MKHHRVVLHGTILLHLASVQAVAQAGMTPQALRVHHGMTVQVSLAQVGRQAPVTLVLVGVIAPVTLVLLAQIGNQYGAY